MLSCLLGIGVNLGFDVMWVVVLESLLVFSLIVDEAKIRSKVFSLEML